MRLKGRRVDSRNIHQPMCVVAASKDHDELDVGVGSSLVNKALRDIEVQSHHGYLIVGIRHADGSTLLNPPSDTRLAAGDIVIVLGHADDIPQLALRLSSSRNTITWRGVSVEA